MLALRDPVRLAIKLLFLASPLLALVLAYFFFDPFRVLYSYDNCYEPPTAVALNRDYVSTEYFVRHHAQVGYDTLVFGNSRTLAYRVADLREVLGDSIHPFHFDASEESLFGLYAKARFVHQLDQRLRHVLIVLDAQLLADLVNDTNNHLKIKDPRLSGENELAFQLVFVRAYFSAFFAPMYLHYRLVGHPLAYMTAFKRQESYVMPENELMLTAWDTEIARDGIDAYLSRRRAVFVPRTPSTGEPVIGAVGRQMLREMEEWFKASGARIEVVISPLYNEVRIADADRKTLAAIFGEERVHDFSGENDFTRDVRNYYETSHYRPPVGAKILRQVYGMGEGIHESAP